MILKMLLFLLIGTIGWLDARDRTAPVWLVFGAVLAAIGVGLSHPLPFFLITSLTTVWLVSMKIGLADKVAIPFLAGAASWIGILMVGMSLMWGWLWITKRGQDAPLLFFFAVSFATLIWF